VVSFFTGPWESNLSGAIDVVVVEKEDGSLGSTPFHVRFGRLPSLQGSEQRVVDLQVNGTRVNVPMKLGAAGEAFFVHETCEVVHRAYMTSPIASPRRGSPSSPPPFFLESDPVLGSSEVSLPPPRLAGMAATGAGAAAATEARPAEEFDDGPSFENYQLLSEGEGEFSADDEEEDEERGQSAFASPHNASETRLSHESTEPGWSWSWGWGAMPVRRKAAKVTGQPMAFEAGPAAAPKDLEVGTELSTATLLDIQQSMYENEDTSLERFHSAVDLATMAGEMEAGAFPGEPGASGGHGVCEGGTHDGGLSGPRLGAIDARGPRPAYDTFDSARVVRPTATRATSDPAAPNGWTMSPGEVPLLSLCGDIIHKDEEDQALARKVFDENLVAFEAFAANAPAILRDPRLLVLINDRLYSWEAAAPYFVSAVAFARPLPRTLMDAAGDGAVFVRGKERGETVPQQELRVSHSSTWRGVWWRQQQPERPIDARAGQPSSRKERRSQSASPVLGTTSSGPAESFIGTPPEHAKRVFAGSSDPFEADEQTAAYRKSLVPTSEQLQALGLKPGMNTVEFKINVRGERHVSAHIFLWSTRTRIVVTDVDGAITRSSGRGNLMPRLSRDWSHSGVAKLFSGIAANGYQFVYLTSRPIGQASSTKDLLGSVSQENATLPLGPVLLSPDSLFQSVQGQRLTQLFKLSALRGVNNLFPDTQCPYHAGFGTSSGDTRAYRKAGIPSGRIFQVDSDGHLCSQNKTFDKTYENILSLVDEIFPPLVDEKLSKSSGRDDFADVNFWKIPVPLIDSSSDEES